MASLHKDEKSPFWYLRAKDSNGKWRSKATPFRHAIPAETRRARQMEAEATAKERQLRDSPLWKTWVPTWIESRFSEPKTKKRVHECWSAIEAFLTERELHHPASVTRRNCFEFHEWRKKNGTHHNTALLELKYFGQILREAKLRGYISENPAERLGIGKVAPKEKAALTDEQIERLRAYCEEQDENLPKGERPWMARALKIALCHGVRLSETQVPLRDVDLDGGIIVFNRTKGGKPFGAPIHPALRPDLERWKAAGEEYTCIVPKRASYAFIRAFRKLGIPGSFHATRVTVATRLAIGGVDERLAKLYMNHSSSLVHAVYVKLKPEHAAGVTSALSYPSAGDKSA